MEKIRIGVVGIGRIGRMHVENIGRYIDKMEVVAVADTPSAMESQKEWLAQQNVTHTYVDYQDLIENPEVDAVLIACTTTLHFDVVIASAKAKKHVFCEKPLELSIEKCKEMIEACRNAGVKLQVGFNRRFDHNFLKIHQLVADGKVGDPHIIRITSRDPAAPPIEYVKSSGGIFMDMTIHDFDLIRYVSGSDVVEVYAAGNVLIDKQIGEANDVDTAIITLKLANGALGVIDNSRQAVYGYDQRVEVFGSKGQALAKNDKPTTVELSTAETESSDKICYFFLDRYTQAFIDEFNGFAEAIQEDREPIVTGEDGLQALKIALAASKSLKDGVPVRVTEED